MSAPSQPLEVARFLNEALAAAPFDQVRAIMQEAASFDDAVGRFREAGLDEVAAGNELVSDDVLVGETDFEGVAAVEGAARGRAAWFRWFRAWFEPWREWSSKALSYEDAGDGAVLVEMVVEVRGEISGAPAELALTQLWVVRDGKVVRYGIFTSPEAASRALAQGAEA